MDHARPSPQKMRKPKRWVVVFIAMALIGTNLELISRAVTQDLVRSSAACIGFDQLGCVTEPMRNFVCCQELKAPSAAGWTSLWMWLVYGIAGVVLGMINEKGSPFRRWPMLAQALLGTFLATGTELVSGLLLNKLFRLQVWDYAWESFQFMQQISLRSGVSFFLIAPFAFWLDDAIRFVAYHEDRPKKLHYYYLELFQIRSRNPGRPDGTSASL